ncbi:MAG: LAGLIDADG family homing endonuclease [Candidatus Omnitrophica bacterium]|nr:LAGLIDADG family homing endonuclease [Candidatus Omnitrophota bacterium]MDD5573705.1 LAGLIDADG family homing endonuclease [Candidatus Omnitrophota bacterium]
MGTENLTNNSSVKGFQTLDPWFVTGFCDGEAAFTFSRSGDNVFALYFSVCQREDNREIIEKMKAFFGGIGKIYIRKEQLSTEKSGRSKPNAYFRVCKQNELLRVIEHFDKFPLQSKKQEVYTIWRDMAIEKTKRFLNCRSDEFKIFSAKLATMNQKSRALKKHST